MDDFRHHSWMDNDTYNIKFAVLYYIYNDWIDFTIIWEAVFRIEVGSLTEQLLEYENS